MSPEPSPPVTGLVVVHQTNETMDFPLYHTNSFFAGATSEACLTTLRGRPVVRLAIPSRPYPSLLSVIRLPLNHLHAYCPCPPVDVSWESGLSLWSPLHTVWVFYGASMDVKQTTDIEHRGHKLGTSPICQMCYSVPRDHHLMPTHLM